MRNRAGDKIYKTVKVTATIGDKRKLPIKTFRLPPDQYFTEEGVDKVLMEVTDWLDTYYPQYDFRMVALGANSFTFIGEEKT